MGSTIYLETVSRSGIAVPSGLGSRMFSPMFSLASPSPWSLREQKLITFQASVVGAIFSLPLGFLCFIHM